MKSTLIRLTLALLIPATASKANDTLATLGAGGLVLLKTNEIEMVSEDLHITTKRITIRYIFRNTTSRNIRATVAFPLPELNGGDLFHIPHSIPDKLHLNFVDFKVESAGRRIPVRLEVRAFKDGEEITAHLKKIGLTGNVLLFPLNQNLRKLPLAARSRLEKEGLIVPEEKIWLGRQRRDGWWANWTMKVQFYWEQVFPANATVELVQSYRPIVGGGAMYSHSFTLKDLQEYCGTQKEIQQVQDFFRTHPSDPYQPTWHLRERQIDYILTTGKNWKGPIKRFTLTVDTDSNEDILVSCFPGLVRTNSTRYSVSIRDFIPTRDLTLFFLQPDRIEH